MALSTTRASPGFAPSVIIDSYASWMPIRVAAGRTSVGELGLEGDRHRGSALLTGQPSLAAWAASSNCSAVMPGTEPTTRSATPVMPVPGWKVTSAVVSSVVGGVPALARPSESDIE